MTKDSRHFAKAVDPLITKLCHYAALEESEKQLLIDAIVRIDEVKKRHDLISAGQRPEHLHLMIDGWACRYKLLENGRHHITAYLLPGDLCDIHVTLLDRMDHSIRTLTSAKVALVSSEKINRLLDQCPRLARAFFWSTLVDEAVLREWLVNAGGRPAEVRIAHVICELLLRSRAAGLAEDDSFILPITQEELGETMGLTVVHTNRILQKLRRNGLITFAKQRMEVHDWKRMQAFAEFAPDYLHLNIQR
ncbi:Crp/Fnr family transcriptional regulator [Halomonas shantousis]